MFIGQAWLCRRIHIVWLENWTEFEHRNGFGTIIFLSRLEQRGKQSPPQNAPLRCDRIRKGYVVMMGNEAAFTLWRRKPVADNFLQAQIDKNIAYTLFPFVNRIANLWGERICHARFRDVIVAITAGNFLEHIGNPYNSFTDIKPVRRCLHLHSLVLNIASKFKPG